MLRITAKSATKAMQPNNASVKNVKDSFMDTAQRENTNNYKNRKNSLRVGIYT